MKNTLTMGSKHYSAFDRTDLSGFDRTTTGKEKTLEKQGASRTVFQSASSGGIPAAGLSFDLARLAFPPAKTLPSYIDFEFFTVPVSSTHNET